MADSIRCCRWSLCSLAYGVIAAAYAFTLFAIRYLCPHDLAPDEAHYWDWSRHLDWCYYSKGPLVAWLIRGGCLIFGDTPFGVRFPAATCSAATLAALHLLTLRTTKSPRLSLAVVLAVLACPPFLALSFLMTIDAPLLCCWAWSTVFLHRAIFGDGRANPSSGTANWFLAGVFVAVGSLAKYTMLFLPMSVVLMLLFHPAWRSHFRKPGFWIFAGVSILGQVPILLWNARHDWLGARHLLRLSGVGDGDGYHLLGPLVYVAAQAGMLLGIWFVAWFGGIITTRPTAGRYSPHTAFLWWLSVPVWLVCLAMNVSTASQPNWPAPAYITGLILAMIWLAERRHLVLVRLAVAAAAPCGAAIAVCFLFPSLYRPTLAQFAHAAAPLDPAPIRKLDPSARLAGWRTLAAEVDRVRARLRQQGEEPLIAGMTWTLPGELGFYCEAHPEVYSFGPALSDRASQYDLWRPNPVFDAQAFQGQTYVYVGAALPRTAFDQTERVSIVEHREDGVVLAVWEVWICRGFRGFAPTDRTERPRY